LQTFNVLVLVDDLLSYAKFLKQNRDGFVQIITEIHSHSMCLCNLFSGLVVCVVLVCVRVCVFVYVFLTLCRRM
jgi:hypothetical protein